jgi:Uma2 family endonuclease
LTAEQLLALPEAERRAELIRGVLHPMSPTGGLHGIVVGELFASLREHVRHHGLGTVYPAETGFRLETNPDTVRAPDVAFVRTGRLADPRVRGYLTLAPDLVAEVISPSDRFSEVEEKARWWLEHGANTVWVIDPDLQQAYIYQAARPRRTLNPEDQLTSELLPDFSLPLTALFAGG